MSGTHGIFQHRTGYFYTILEEDFCEIYKAEGVNEVCRAYITSILENLTNKQFDENGSNDDIWVFMSLPEMARRMRNAYSERTIHKEIQGMIKDGFLKKRRAAQKATMEYWVNIKKIQDALVSLPDKQSCRIARSNLAELQDPPCRIARSTLQNCKNDLAELQPRISNRLTIEETKEEESIVSDTEAKPLAPNVALSLSSQSSLPSFTQEETQEEKSPIAKVTTGKDQSIEHTSLPTKASSKKKVAEPKGPPVMPAVDAPWPSREIAVQIVEAKKGRIYSTTTRKQELEEAGKILEMTVDNAPITREQFESAWDDLASSSWWEEHGKPCMIKYLRRDDTIIGIIKKLAKKGQKRATSPQEQSQQSKPKSLVERNAEKMQFAGRRK